MALKMLKPNRIGIQINSSSIAGLDTSSLTVPFKEGIAVRKVRYGWVAERVEGRGALCDDQCVYYPEQRRDNYNMICEYCREHNGRIERYIKKG